MSYAFVQDIPASWEQYGPLAAAIGDPVPEGLILHVAGPIDEGFRTIEVWETREAWERFQRDQAKAAAVQLDISGAPAVREFRALNTVHGVVSSGATL